MSDADALLRAILSDPDDDLPRLVYADYLEEHGEPERAEFVRVQCEIWQTGRGLCYATCRPPDFNGCPNAALRRRDRELLAWFVAEDLSVELGLPPHESLYVTDSGWICPRLGVELVPRRGFVAEVSLPLATFAGGGPCEVCRHWARGHGTYRNLGHPYCATCRGEGLTTGIAPPLFSSHPVKRVTLTGREPTRYRITYDGWYWNRIPKEDGHLPLDNDLPEELFDLLEAWAEHDPGDPDDHYPRKKYRSHTAALDDLSAACVAWGRDRAGLPPPKQLKVADR